MRTSAPSWLVGALLLAGCAEPLPPPGVAREVVLDLLEDDVHWTVLEQRPGAPPRRAALAPSLDPYRDGGDLPALVLPPSASVELTLPEAEGPLRLRAASGVDVSLARRLPAGGPPVTIHFEAQIDGRLVHGREVVVEPRSGRPGPGDGTDWGWIGGPEGLEVRPGARLVLRTRAAGLRSLAADDLLVGFGGLTLEREVARPRQRARPDSPNLVLFVMDTQRADRVGAYGYGRPTTPHLDRLAARGVLFESALATSSWTWPATASLLTGLPPEGHGVHSHRECWLGHSLETLAEALGRRGYATGGFSANPLVSPERNFHQGFERFEATRHFADGELVMPGVLDWVRAHAGVRFFLYVHLVDPHYPHNPLPAELERLGLAQPTGFPEGGYQRILEATRLRLQAAPGAREPLERAAPPAARRWISDVYDACVASGDHWLGELVGLLEELGLADRTVIAYTSDHGEELLDHGTYDHAHSLHPELVEVPLVLAGPGVPRGVRVSTPVSNRHLAPTLALLGGAELAAATDALDLTRPRDVVRREIHVSTRKGLWGASEAMEILGVRRDRYSLHWAPKGKPHGNGPGAAPTGDARLYDLARDPHEQHDLAHERPELVVELIDAVRAHQVRWKALAPSARATGAATFELLRAVGYAGDEEGPR